MVTKISLYTKWWSILMGPFLLISWYLDGFCFLLFPFPTVFVLKFFKLSFFEKPQTLTFIIFHYTLILSDWNLFQFEKTTPFNGNAIHFLFQICLLWLQDLMGSHFFDWKIWWVVSYKSVSYKKVLPAIKFKCWVAVTELPLLSYSS